MIRALVNGQLFEQAISISVHRSIRNLVGWFDLASSAAAGDVLPIKCGDRIELLSEGRNRLLTGFVEELSITQGADDHEIRIAGRDLAADLVDSTLKVKTYNGPISLEDLVKRVISDQGLSLSVINEAGNLAKLKEADLVAGEIGQSAFAFLEQYARHVQAVLTCNGKGEVVILRAGPRAGSFSLLRQADNPATNILSSSLTLNQSGRFRDYVCRSQLSPASKKFDLLSKDVANQSGTATDPEARAGRFFEFDHDVSGDSLTCGDRAKLEANVRRASSLDYSATVQGIPEGLEINRQIAVLDDLCRINSILLVTELEHQFDLEGGTTTTIRLTYKDAFTLEESVAAADASREETGESLLTLGGS